MFEFISEFRQKLNILIRLVRRINIIGETLMGKQEELKAAFDDLALEVGRIKEDVGLAVTGLTTLKAQIDQLLNQETLVSGADLKALQDTLTSAAAPLEAIVRPAEAPGAPAPEVAAVESEDAAGPTATPSPAAEAPPTAEAPPATEQKPDTGPQG